MNFPRKTSKAGSTHYRNVSSSKNWFLTSQHTFFSTWQKLIPQPNFQINHLEDGAGFCLLFAEQSHRNIERRWCLSPGLPRRLSLKVLVCILKDNFRVLFEEWRINFLSSLFSVFKDEILSFPKTQKFWKTSICNACLWVTCLQSNHPPLARAPSETWTLCFQSTHPKVIMILTGSTQLKPTCFLCLLQNSLWLYKDLKAQWPSLGSKDQSPGQSLLGSASEFRWDQS